MGNKKTFKNSLQNPAELFISDPVKENPQGEAGEQPEPPDGFKLNPLFVEKKTKRLQLILQPSLFDKLKATAKGKGVSVNEFCHQILKQATREDN